MSNQDLLNFCNAYWQDQVSKPRGTIKFILAERILDIYRRDRCTLVILAIGQKNPRCMVLNNDLLDNLAN